MTAKTIAVMQPYLLPYLGYFQLMAAADVFVIFDDVAFIKRGYINRNSILLSGEPHRFTLPVAKASQNRLILDHDLAGTAAPLLDLFQRAYEGAPCFEAGYSLVKTSLSGPLPNLAEFLTHSLVQVSEALALDCDIIRASSVAIDPALKGQDRILALVSALDGTAYVNAGGGRELYSAPIFQDQGIALSFIDFEARPYDQFKGGPAFTAHLSIVDHLMNRPLADVRADCLDVRQSA